MSDKESASYQSATRRETQEPCSVVLSCSIITPECRENKTACGAFQEATARAFAEYLLCTGNPNNADKAYRLVLSLIKK